MRRGKENSLNHVLELGKRVVGVESYQAVFDRRDEFHPLIRVGLGTVGGLFQIVMPSTLRYQINSGPEYDSPLDKYNSFANRMNCYMVDTLGVVLCAELINNPSDLLIAAVVKIIANTATHLSYDSFVLPDEPGR
jgi:hypothetical protein